MNESSSNEPINENKNCPSEENTMNNNNKYPSDNNTNNDNNNNIKNNDDSPQEDGRSCPTRWFYVDPLRFVRIILTIIALILYVSATTKKPFVFVSGNFATTESVEAEGGSGQATVSAAATIEMYFIKMKFCIEANVDVKADKNEELNEEAQAEVDKEAAKHNKKIDRECKEIMFNDIPNELKLGDHTFNLKEISKHIKEPMRIFHTCVITISIIIGVVLIIFILSIIRTLATDVLGIIASIVSFICALVSLVLGGAVIASTKIPFDEMASQQSSSEPDVKTKVEGKNSVAAMLVIAALMLGAVAFCCCICCLSCRRFCCCCCRKESCLDPDYDDDTKVDEQQ